MKIRVQKIKTKLVRHTLQLKEITESHRYQQLVYLLRIKMILLLLIIQNFRMQMSLNLFEYVILDMNAFVNLFCCKIHLRIYFSIIFCMNYGSIYLFITFYFNSINIQIKLPTY